MKEYLKFAFVLFVITALASGILAYVNSFTKPIIVQNQLKEKELARKEVLPNATAFDSLSVINNETAYFAKDKKGNIIGYTFVASKYGYSSNVKTMVGLTTDFAINKIKIIYQSETPGLGANSEKPWFQDQFAKMKQKNLKVDKDGGDVKALTGATITSRAITNSINEGISMMKKAIVPYIKSSEQGGTSE